VEVPVEGGSKVVKKKKEDCGVDGDETTEEPIEACIPASG
jgi:hypothetical protein